MQQVGGGDSRTVVRSDSGRSTFNRTLEARISSSFYEGRRCVCSTIALDRRAERGAAATKENIGSICPNEHS
jgi:hypothetical protein